MSYRNPHSRSGLTGSVTLFMLIAMMAAAAGGSLGSREPIRDVPAAAHADASRTFRWTADDIHHLIAAIEESEGSGFDSRRYGLAALRSELEQTTDLWGRPGTPQLDTLANASALALANDHRTRAGLARVTAHDIDIALAEGNLRSWLMATDA